MHQINEPGARKLPGVEAKRLGEAGITAGDAQLQV
jgi:hypothetical protein